MSAATMEVSKVGASADTSQANLPDIEVGTFRNRTWLAFDWVVWKILIFWECSVVAL